MKKCLALLLLFAIAPVWAAPKLDGSPFQGEVLESINAGSYTYLRLKNQGRGGLGRDLAIQFREGLACATARPGADDQL